MVQKLLVDMVVGKLLNTAQNSDFCSIVPRCKVVKTQNFGQIFQMLLNSLIFAYFHDLQVTVKKINILIIIVKFNCRAVKKQQKKKKNTNKQTNKQNLAEKINVAKNFNFC